MSEVEKQANWPLRVVCVVIVAIGLVALALRDSDGPTPIYDAEELAYVVTNALRGNPEGGSVSPSRVTCREGIDMSRVGDVAHCSIPDRGRDLLITVTVKKVEGNNSELEFETYREGRKEPADAAPATHS